MRQKDYYNWAIIPYLTQKNNFRNFNFHIKLSFNLLLQSLEVFVHKSKIQPELTDKNLLS